MDKGRFLRWARDAGPACCADDYIPGNGLDNGHESSTCGCTFALHGADSAYGVKLKIPTMDRQDPTLHLVLRLLYRYVGAAVSGLDLWWRIGRAQVPSSNPWGTLKLKVLFANPPILGDGRRFNRPVRFPQFDYATKVLHPPMMLAYAAAYVRAHGHVVDLLDAPALQLDSQAFIRRAEAFEPDFVVFETSTASLKNDAQLIHMVKERTHSKTILVGPHVSAMPHESLAISDADAVMMGEHEQTLLEYIERGPLNTDGVAYRRSDGQIVVNDRRPLPSNLDSYPFPARDLLPIERYFDPILRNPFTFVLSGRGCPYRCIFCNWPQVFWGHVYRTRSPGNVVDELEHLEESYALRSFLFNDDTFTANKAHAIAVCEEIIRRGVTLPWGAYARPDLDDRLLLRTMKRAGCFLLKVGVESGNEQVLKNMRKGTKLESIRAGIRAMKDEGFHVHGTFVFGMPGETHETIQETIEFAKELDPTTVQFSTAVPYPGTEFHAYLEEKGYLKIVDWDQQMPLNPTYEYEGISAEDLKNAVRKAYRTYYLRRKFAPVVMKGLIHEPRRVLANVYTVLKFSLSNAQ